MQLEVNAIKLQSALRGIIALSSFAKKVKDDTANPCLLTAENGKLVLEAANYGLYIKQTLDAEVDKEGSIGISASMLSRCTAQGTIKIKYNEKSKSVSVSSAPHRYRIKELKLAEELVTTGRPSKARLKSQYLSSLTVDDFKTLISTISFKPGLKEETLRVQMEFKKKKGKVGSITVTGLDAYSFARVEMKGKDIRVKKAFKAILKTTILNNIIKELISSSDDEYEDVASGLKIRVGMVYDADGNSSLIRFTTSEFDIFHPILSIPFDNIDMVLKRASDPKNIDCSFVLKRHVLAEAVGAVTALATGSESVVLSLKASKDGIKLTTSSDNNRAETDLTAKKIEIKDKAASTITVQSKYFSSFVHLAPEVPLKIESCGKAYVRLSSLNLKSSSVEFLIARVSQKAQN